MRVRRVVCSTLLCLTPIVTPIVAVHGQSRSETAVRAVAEWEAARSDRSRSQRHFDDYSSQFTGVDGCPGKK